MGVLYNTVLQFKEPDSEIISITDYIFSIFQISQLKRALIFIYSKIKLILKTKKLHGGLNLYKGEIIHLELSI